MQSIAVLDWTNGDLAPHLLLGVDQSALSKAGVYMRICGRHLWRRDWSILVEFGRVVVPVPKSFISLRELVN